jgi:hypothetical protein
MSVSSILAAAFRRAYQRPGAVVLDLIWKGIWGIGMVSVLGIAFSWIYWQIGSLRIQAPQSAFANPLTWIVVAREIWQQYSGPFFWTTAAVIVWCTVSWILLEAYFRSGFLPNKGRGFFENSRSYFKTFIACSTAKLLVASAVTTLMAAVVFGDYLKTPFREWPILWVDSRGAAAIVFVLLCVMWFTLTLFETGIRLKASEAFGQHLFALIGAVGTLLFFEGMMLAGGIGLAIIFVSLVSGPTGAILMMAALASGAILLAVFHSYLIVVRYSVFHVAMRTSSVPEGPSIIGHVDEFRDRSHPRFWLPIHTTDRSPHS